MDLFRKDFERETCLFIDGELDAYTVRRLLPVLDQILTRRRVTIIIDLSRLELIDSVGVAAIVSLFKRARRQGVSVAVVGAKSQPRAMLQLLRLDRVLCRAGEDRHESWAFAQSAQVLNSPGS
jgi:anti-anti-sigma factor